MESLEYFDPYTSYNLHWFPYEITHCKKLIDSRVSTRALFGNFKNRKPFPKLDHNPVRYTGDTVHCSVCQKPMTYAETNQKWITLRVATDDLPLLVNLCSTQCEEQLPSPRKGYVAGPHKGGAHLEQPSYEEWAAAHTRRIPFKEIEAQMKKQNQSNSKPRLLKLIRKIWEK